MLPLPRSAAVAVVSVAAGGALYGAAAGGLVAIDRDLQADVRPPARIRTVEFREVAEPAQGPREDCPRRARSTDEGSV
ncbi:MAG: hypothetical protein QOD44_515 [Solirubrobacteraceae bacterium]|jgi:hypothetical protein|nr:hypothetical protein [Solirubrobacteraceae bacterium]